MDVQRRNHAGTETNTNPFQPGCWDGEKPWGPIVLDLGLPIKHAAPPPGSLGQDQ